VILNNVDIKCVSLKTTLKHRMDVARMLDVGAIILFENSLVRKSNYC
jgi:hypothetical protein